MSNKDIMRNKPCVKGCINVKGAMSFVVHYVGHVNSDTFKLQESGLSLVLVDSKLKRPSRNHKHAIAREVIHRNVMTSYTVKEFAYLLTQDMEIMKKMFVYRKGWGCYRLHVKLLFVCAPPPPLPSSQYKYHYTTGSILKRVIHLQFHKPCNIFIPVFFLNLSISLVTFSFHHMIFFLNF